MQTIIGIVICLIIIVYFLIGFMDTYTEGLTAPSATPSTPATPSGVVASASGGIPLASVVEKIRLDTTALSAIVGIDNNSTNKQLYTEHIDNLLDYYDYQILNELANVKINESGIYDLKNIIKYNQIKEVLIGSHKFLAL